MKYIAFVTKGLETICEEELKSLKEVKILNVVQKFIFFEYSGDISCLENLRTIDDISIYVSEIPIEKVMNIDLEKEVGELKKIIDFIGKYRKLENTFSLTISKYKNNDIKDEELKNTLSEYFSKELGFTYTPLNHSNFDLRININENVCIVSVKLLPQSLFRRGYNHETILGSIRSTIASAMIYKLIGNSSDLKMVDNFCGSGTFLCEALLSGFTLYGGDIDKNAVDITKRNLKKISNKEFQIFESDATNTKWQNDYFDIAVSNLPWDKQIKIDRVVKLFDLTVKEYARILKCDAKVGFITTKPDLLIKYLKKYFDIKHQEIYKIGYLGQVPTIVLAEVKKENKIV